MPGLMREACLRSDEPGIGVFPANERKGAPETEIFEFAAAFERHARRRR
jgi:hypothetical protein